MKIRCIEYGLDNDEEFDRLDSYLNSLNEFYIGPRIISKNGVSFCQNIYSDGADDLSGEYLTGGMNGVRTRILRVLADSKLHKIVEDFIDSENSSRDS